MNNSSARGDLAQAGRQVMSEIQVFRAGSLHPDQTVCMSHDVHVRGIPSAAVPAWRPMENMPDDVRQVIVCWSTGEFDVIGKAEYLEILGFGEPPALGWMPLPAPPRAPLVTESACCSLSSAPQSDGHAHDRSSSPSSTALRACAEAPAPKEGEVMDDDQSRGETPEISQPLQSSASVDGVITTPAPNKDVGAYIASMADGDCFGADPENECRDVFSVDQWCKSCLAVEVIDWHHAEMERRLRAEALAPSPDTDDVLDRLEEYLDNHSDVDDGDSGPVANTAMRLLDDLQR